MSARVLFIGLDAAEPTLLREGAASGMFSTIARLAHSGAEVSLDNCMHTLPGAVWPEIASGISCGRLPRFFHPRQIITGSAAPRSLQAADVADDPTFWKEASNQGKRVAIVDIPHTPLTPRLNGIQVCEYGLHDPHFGAGSTPASLLGELQRTHGMYPVASCDHRGGTVRRNLQLLDDLLVAIDRKTNVILDLLSRDRWDLFACAFSESHCGGHWFWHYSDPSHWGHDAKAPKALRDAVTTIYRHLDTAVGRIADAAGADTMLVLASHGMAPYVAGYQLLPEVLVRLGLGSGPAHAGRRMRNLQQTIKHWIPRRYWEGLTHRIVEQPLARGLLAPLQRGSGAMFFPLESPLTRAAAVPNNTIGAVRLNLRGREPFGCVDPGRDADALAGKIRRELLALRQPGTGAPIVSDVSTAAEIFGTDHHPDVPDLIVGFRQDLGLLEACESAAVGRIHVPVGSRWGRRSGDHSPRSAIWMAGAGIDHRHIRDVRSLLDVAPTVLSALGCGGGAAL